MGLPGWTRRPSEARGSRAARPCRPALRGRSVRPSPVTPAPASPAPLVTPGPRPYPAPPPPLSPGVPAPPSQPRPCRSPQPGSVAEDRPEPSAAQPKRRRNRHSQGLSADPKSAIERRSPKGSQLDQSESELCQRTQKEQRSEPIERGWRRD